MSKSTSRRPQRAKTASNENFKDNTEAAPRPNMPRPDASPSETRPSMPRPNVPEVVDLQAQLDQPAWVSQLRLDLTNAIKSKIHISFNELQEKIFKRLGTAEQNISKLNKNQSITLHKLKVSEALIQAN